MKIASLKTALDTATKPDAEIYGLFMPRLKSDIGEIVDILNVAYQKIDPRVRIGAYYPFFNQVDIHYHRENLTDDEYDIAVTKCHENGSNPDDIEVFDDYSWSIEMDITQQRFLLKCSGCEDELEKDFPLTEAGFQSLVCHVADLLNQFIPTDVRIAYFLESSRRQGQQMLNFVLE